MAIFSHKKTDGPIMQHGLTSGRMSPLLSSCRNAQSYALFVVTVLFCYVLAHPKVLQSTGASAASVARARTQYVMPIPPFKTRADLGDVLESEGMKVGVELGVQHGKYADLILRRWAGAERYVLVDLWRFQRNYVDMANVNDSMQADYKKLALGKMEKFKKRGTAIDVCQGLTINCVKRFPDKSFDFIYVDARHDYKGVTQDLSYWWPKLKDGAIIAGHDYVVNKDGPAGSGQDWSINYDGTVDPSGRAVKGAVDDFFNEKGLQISVSYREGGFNTWAVRKPGPHPYLGKNATAAKPAN